ncbi:hypothetical protein F3I35_15965 [Pantoea sp. Bo_7]|uniref:hypothetical protein n=1 Tax=unclassified Pantoea TaxID=2630326 RepID=UPI00123251BC|nr:MULTISPECIES: hypothetical protein [unclassified Pantoea]KAA6043267.1 hypothetical protein F3I35_15965 [Pantoea sp. Bo_7]KAA6088251.1 hypothetical protein F3I22_16465 [Pantoea sp. Bo_10]
MSGLSQLDKILHSRNNNNLVVSLDEPGFEQLQPVTKKENAYAAHSIDALLIDNSGCLASNIITTVPELRQPAQTQKEADTLLKIMNKGKSSAGIKINAERPADAQIYNATAKLMEQTDELKLTNQLSDSIDYSNLSGYSLKWSKVMDLVIQLLQLLKTMDDKLKSKFQSLQTESTERSAKKTIAAGQNVLTGAISGAAVNVAWTTGSVAISARKSNQHVKKTSNNLDDQQKRNRNNAKIRDAQDKPTIDKNKNLKDKKKAKQDNEHINEIGSTKPEENYRSNKMFRDKEKHDDVMRSLYATQMFGSSFEKVAGAAGEAQASSNRAQSAIADNDRSIHQKTSENSLDMEGKTHKILQAIFDLLTQLLNNTASTNNTIVNRAN